MKGLHVVTTIISNIVLIILGLVALYIFTSNVSLFGGYQSLLVQSGSMEPSIMTGDIVVIQPKDKYIQNDTITFRETDGRIVTHRIMKTLTTDGQEAVVTKGDANSSEDADPIPLLQIMGKVVFVIPKLGYLVAFAKSLPGLIVLIMIPAALFVIDELAKLKNA